MSSHSGTIQYHAVSTPASVNDVETMYACIYEAHSLAAVLTSLSDEDIDIHVVTGVGDLLIRTLSQPLEASGAILSEKRDADD